MSAQFVVSFQRLDLDDSQIIDGDPHKSVVAECMCTDCLARRHRCGHQNVDVFRFLRVSHHRSSANPGHRRASTSFASSLRGFSGLFCNHGVTPALVLRVGLLGLVVVRVESGPSFGI